MKKNKIVSVAVFLLFLFSSIVSADMSFKQYTPSYGINVQDIAIDDTYVYVGGGAVVNKVRQYWKSNMSFKAESLSYGHIIYALTVDDDYVYAGGSTTQKVYQYWKSNLTKKAETADYGGAIYALTVDDTYVYAGGGTTNKVFQYWKSNMTKKAETASYGGSIAEIEDDADYVYVGGNVAGYPIQQYWKSNMTKKDETANYGGSISGIVIDDDYVYAGGSTTQKVYQYWKSNLTKKAESADYGGTIYDITGDTDYIYGGGGPTNKVYRYLKSDMSKVDEVAYSTWIYTVENDEHYVYAAGLGSFRVYQYYKENQSDPVISDPWPEELDTYEIQPTCRVTVNDGDGEPMNVTFAAYELVGLDLDWVNKQTNSSVGDGTYTWFYSNASIPGTFFWRVYVDDGRINVTSDTYYINIQEPLWTEDEEPEDETEEVGLLPFLNVTCINYFGGDMNATWWWGYEEGGPWSYFASNTSISNNTVITQKNSNFSEKNTVYSWSVNLSDGEGHWGNNSYYFKTLAGFNSIDEENDTALADMNTCIQQGRDCTLYAVYLTSEGVYQFHLAASSDNGTTWNIHSFLDVEYALAETGVSFMIDGNGTMHFAWITEIEEDVYAVMYSRSFDDGNIWEEVVILEYTDLSTYLTGCLDYYGNVHLFYSDLYGEEDRIIYHIVSFDDGDTWNEESDTVVSSISLSMGFSVASDFDEESYLYVVFYDDDGGDPPGYVYITSSIDNGTSWSEPVCINDSVYSWNSDNFHITIDSLHTIHLVGALYNETDYSQLVYTRSYDNGDTWDALANLTDMGDFAFYNTDISVDMNDIIYVLYVEDEDHYISYFNSSDGGDSFYDDPVEHILVTGIEVNFMNVWWSNYPETCEEDIKVNVPNTGLFLIFNDADGYLYATFSDDFGLNCGCFPEYVPPPQTWYPIDLGNESYIDPVGTSIQQGRNCTIYAVYFAPEGEDQYYFHLASSVDNGTTWTTHSFLEEYYVLWWTAIFLIDVNGTMHFAWMDEAYYLMYSRSFDDGVTWSEPVVLITSELIVIDGYFDYYGNMHVFWSNFTSISHIVSYDAGNSWNNESFDVVYFGNIFPAFSGAADYDGVSYIYIIFYDSSTGGLYITHSVDNGTSWSEPVLVDDIIPLPMYFYIAVDGDHVLHFVDVEGIDEEYFVSYTRSFDHGATWDEIVNLVTVEMFGPFMGEYGWITTDCNDNVYIIFIDEGVIYYYLSSDGGDSFYLGPDAQTISDEISGAYSFNPWWSNYPEDDVCGDKMNIPDAGLFLIFNDDDNLYLYSAFSEDFDFNCCLGPVPAIITISNPYPGNNSNHIKINVTLSITINHLNGNQMNITWYWGNSSANATHYLGSTLSVINGTYSMAIVPANQTYTDYWWNVNVTSGTDYAVGIYNFKTSVKSGGIIVADKKFVLGLCIGILLFFVLVMVMRSRKRND
jgi:hypothetical protein